jgi:hypothetical protein
MHSHTHAYIGACVALVVASALLTLLPTHAHAEDCGGVSYRGANASCPIRFGVPSTLSTKQLKDFSEYFKLWEREGKDTHAYVCMYVCVYVCVCMCVCVVLVFVIVTSMWCANVLSLFHHTHTPLHTHTHTHAFCPTHTHNHSLTRTYIHTHTHAQACF